VPGAVPAAAGGARNPAIPLGETKIVEPIEKPTLNGAELAVLYRKYTGRRVIVAAAAAAAEFSFVQDASPQDPLTYALAAELLKKAAAIENFVFMPDEKNPNLDVLTVSTRPPGIGYDVFNENDPLPEGDAVISYVMTFKHLKPETAAQAFTQIIGQFGTYGSIAPLNGSVVITENTSLIRRLIKLKDEIDKPSDITGTRFIAVKYADVTELAATLNELLNTQQQAQKTAAVQRASVPAAPAVPGAPAAAVPQMPGGTSGGASTSTDTPVQIIPEPRTNRVFAMGRPVDLLFVEGLIREFDIETSEKTFLRRKLSFLAVSDFLPIAENALNRAFTAEVSSASGGAAGGATGASSRSSRSGTTSTTGGRSSGSTGRNSSTTSGNNSFGGGNSSFGGGNSSFGGGGGSSGSGSSLSSPNASTAPESRLVGRTLLVADNITNSIVVQGPPSGLEIIERLLDQVDVKADQVMISTVIGQLTLTDDKQFGVGYLFNGSDVRGGGGGGVPTFTPGTGTGTAATATNAFPELSLSDIATAGLRLYGKTGDLNIFLKALQDKGDFTVLARPSIFTANNQKGVISSGERVAIPTGTNTYGAGVSGNVSTQIQYQDVVLKLEVVPLINSESEITLQISLLNDEVNGTQSIAGGAGAEPLVVPKITTREILTTVTIPNNETIVLGGLITVRKGDSVSGIPLLSSIPYLGRLFSSTTKKDERAELLVFLQPSIIRSRGSLDSLQSDVDSRYKVSGKLRNFSDGPDVLPPVETIAPVADKAAAPKAKPVKSLPPPGKTKKSVRPAQRGV
jgi:type II secretion system protein D